MKTYADRQCNLILPDSFYEDKEAMVNSFQKSLEKFLSDNSDVDHPYFLLFKGAFDENNPLVNRQAFSRYARRPPLITNSMVFWVDNKRGACLLLWHVDDSKAHFNTEEAKKYQGVLRSAAD